MPAAFKLYRIICTITDKALVYGSDYSHHHLAGPGFKGRYKGVWYERGQWSQTGGSFWKTEWTVKRHLQNLCHDWERKWGASGHYSDTWMAVIPGSLDWSRLKDLSVEELLVTKYSTIKLAAADFMGIPEERAA